MKRLIYPGIVLILYSCGDSGEKHSKSQFPNPHYHYVSVDRAAFNTVQQYYVPVYSSIYGESGKSQFLLSSTLSIRNTGYDDSFYVSKVYYYGSDGKLLKKYIDSTVLVKPMASMEVVVEMNEKEGGAGANFIVECLGHNMLNEPLIQAVMTTGDLRMAFPVEAVKIKTK